MNSGATTVKYPSQQESAEWKVRVRLMGTVVRARAAGITAGPPRTTDAVGPE